jgi:hypothetical protein
MKNIFSQYVERDGVAAIKLQTVFDAGRDAPLQISELSRSLPQIDQVMDSLRDFVPLTPNAAVGPHCDGAFYRLPNHYRSVSFLLPPTDGGDPDAVPGAIVFKGTEPLMPGFDEYFDWMLSAPIRASPLPLGFHFPLDMRIPPGAMWIHECTAEQELATAVQKRFLDEFGYFGRLPIPLFVFKFPDASVNRYSQTVRARMSEFAFKKFSNKLQDGLGVEVYFYPTVPVRVADLSSGNMKDAFGEFLSTECVADTTGKWARLFAELLQLRYMPYVPWHHGMGACVDFGNACLDGGFNDMLTISPFEVIPSRALLRRSLSASIRVFADTIASYCNAAAGGNGLVSQDAEAAAFAQRYAWERIREHLRSFKSEGRNVDDNLMAFLEMPSTADIVSVLREDLAQRDRKLQYICDQASVITEAKAACA